MSARVRRRRLSVAGAALMLAVVAAKIWLPETAFAVLAGVDGLADGRSGPVTFASFTPTPRDLEAGTFKTGAVEVTAELTLPAGTGRVPAAILVHGSAGVSDHHRRYARLLAKWGIAALVVDSFSPRGITSTVGDQGAISPHAMLVDAYAALELLATHPRIDRKRIALIGWSKGGTVALLAARRRYRDRLAKADHRFAALVGFYPWCGEQDSRLALTGAPLLLLLGAEDDWTGARACQDYAKRIAAAGYPVKAITYPGAEHGFDYDGQARYYLARARDWSDCTYLARRDGFVIARNGRFRPWSALGDYFRACSRPGAHTAANPAARDRAHADLKAFLFSVFKLDGDQSARATHSISTSNSKGQEATVTKVRAGGWAPKYSR